MHVSHDCVALHLFVLISLFLPVCCLRLAGPAEVLEVDTIEAEIDINKHCYCLNLVYWSGRTKQDHAFWHQCDVEKGIGREPPHFGDCPQGKTFRPTNGSLQKRHGPNETTAILAHRRVMFVGDSVTRGIMEYLACFIADTNNGFEIVEPRGYINTEYYFVNLNLTIGFRGGGRQWEELQMCPYDLVETLPIVVAELGPKDIIIVNSGVHDNSLVEMKEKSVAVAKALADIKNKCDASCPSILWRESTPQHFNSPNGLYINSASGACVPLGGDCAPGCDKTEECECVPANIRNSLTNPIVEAAGIPVIPVWESLAPLHAEHEQADCTHYSLAVYDYIVQATMNVLVGSKFQFISGHWTTSE